MPEEQEWIAPQEAARRVSERVGFIVTPEDLKQLRRRGKITQGRPINSRIILYNADEIATIDPPKKRVRSEETWGQYLDRQRRKRRESSHDGSLDEAA